MNLDGNNFKIWHYWGNLLIFLSFCYWFFVCFLFAFVFSLSSFYNVFLFVMLSFSIFLTLFHFIFYRKVLLYRPLYFISVLCLFVWFFVSQLFFLYIFLLTFFCCFGIFIPISDFVFFWEIHFEETYIFFMWQFTCTRGESFFHLKINSQENVFPRYFLHRIVKNYLLHQVIPTPFFEPLVIPYDGSPSLHVSSFKTSNVFFLNILFFLRILANSFWVFFRWFRVKEMLSLSRYITYFCPL